MRISDWSSDVCSSDLRLAGALALDVTKDWTPTVDSYLGRVTKAHIVEAVAEGVSEDAARRIADMKKPAMAQAADQLLAGTGWLPRVLRTPKPEGEQPATAEAAAAQVGPRPPQATQQQHTTGKRRGGD